MSEQSTDQLKQKLKAVRQLSKQMYQPLPTQFTDRLLADYSQVLDVDVSKLEVEPLDLPTDFADVSNQGEQAPSRQFKSSRQDNEPGIQSQSKLQRLSKPAKKSEFDSSLPVYSLHRDKSQQSEQTKQNGRSKKHESSNGSDPVKNKMGDGFNRSSRKGETKSNKSPDEQTLSAMQHLDKLGELAQQQTREKKQRTVDKSSSGDDGETVQIESPMIGKQQTSPKKNGVSQLPIALKTLDKLADDVIKRGASKKKINGFDETRKRPTADGKQYQSDRLDEQQSSPFDEKPENSTQSSQSIHLDEVNVTTESRNNEMPQAHRPRQLTDADPEELASLVNDVLMRQARRYGVDLS